VVGLADLTTTAGRYSEGFPYAVTRWVVYQRQPGAMMSFMGGESSLKESPTGSRAADVQKTLDHVVSAIGKPSAWGEWPGGWAGDIEAALVDAVFSARAVYRSKRGRGVRAQVVAWGATRKRHSFTLDALASEIIAVGPSAWAKTFGNEQRSPSRSEAAPGGPSKAATVLEAADVLVAVGVSKAAQINESNVTEVKQTLRSVPGVGYATTNYFLMLLGRPGVKPDRMVHRFLEEACGHRFTDARADQVVTDAATELGVQANELDHAIWKYESELARQ